MPTKEQNTKFINMMSELVVSNYENCKILPSIRLSQLIEESGYGSSELAVKANNFCGIKHASYPTKKWYVYKGIKWAVFDSPEQCVICQGLYYMSKRHYYGKIIGEKNLEIALTELELSPYCADKGYDKRLMKIIKLYNLTQYDDKVLNTSNKVIIDKKKFEKIQKVTGIDKTWIEPTELMIEKYGKTLVIKLYNKIFNEKITDYLLAIHSIKNHIKITDIHLWVEFIDVKPKHIKALIEKLADTI